MALISLEVSGFKNYLEKHTFTFGMVNQILGGHGKGKTALGESIVWCLYGCDLHGKGIIRRLKNRDSKEMKVESIWDFKGPDGIKRRHSFCRVTKGRTRLFLDGKEASQSDFEAFFGPRETFLSIFLPGYFGRSSKDRNVILSLLPSHDYGSIVRTLSESDQNRLKNFDMSDPVQCFRDLKKELTDWNDYLKELDSKITGIRMSVALNGSSEHIQEEDRRLEKLKIELDSLAEGPNLPEILLEWERELSTLGSRFRALEREWKEIKKAPNSQFDVRQRQVELEKIKDLCQMILDEGFAVKERIQSEKEVYEEEHNNKILQLQAEIIRLQAKQSVRRKNEKQAEYLPQLQKKLDEGIIERNKVLEELQSVQNFMLQYADMQVESANRELKRAEILLTKKPNEEGATLQYKLLYDKKEYCSLSSSEKIRCSFELSQLALMKGRSIPVFIDYGGANVAFMDATTTQLFVTSVIPGSALTHEVVA